MIRAIKSISSIHNEDYEIEICDCLVELIENLVIKSDIKDLLEKSSSAESTYIALQIINCLTNSLDKQSASLNKKSDKHKRDANNKSKESSKWCMMSPTIYRFLERLNHHESKPSSDNISLSKWLQSTIEKYLNIFFSGKGSVSLEDLENSNLLKEILSNKNSQHDDMLLKITSSNEKLWCWNHVISSLSITSSKNFDVLMLNG